MLDMIGSAKDAVWATVAGEVEFGLLSESTGPSVQQRTSERMEDDNIYRNILYLHPPAPSLRALRGVYQAVNIPDGRIELHIDFGMLWATAPAPDEITQVDGVIFEAGFLLSANGEEVNLLPRTTCVHDGSIERFIVDAGAIAGKLVQLT